MEYVQKKTEKANYVYKYIKKSVNFEKIFRIILWDSY